MKSHSLTRRLAAGAAGLVVGLAGMAALATPASAGHDNDGDGKRWGKEAGLTGTAECDIESETWTVTWTVTNPSKKTNATVEALSSDVDGIDFDDVVHAKKSVEGTQTFPSGTESASLTVELRWAWQGWKGHWKITTDEATADVALGDCAPEGPPPTQPPPVDEEPDGPSGFADAEVDCDVFVMIIVSDSEADVVLTVVPSEGDSVEVTVPAGETVEVEVPSSEGLVVDLQLDGVSVLQDGPFEITSEIWTELDCEEGEGGELPVTGVSTGLIALGAVVLLALGGGLFMVARRRRVTFTA